MVKVGTLLGGEANSTRHQMEEVFQLEKKLAEIYEPKERLRDMEKIYHKMTVAELQQLAPAVRRSEFLPTVLSGERKQGCHVERFSALLSFPIHVPSLIVRCFSTH